MPAHVFEAALPGKRQGLTAYTPHFISETRQRPLAGYAALGTAYAGFFGGGLTLAARSGRELPAVAAALTVKAVADVLHIGYARAVT